MRQQRLTLLLATGCVVAMTQLAAATSIIQYIAIYPGMGDGSGRGVNESGQVVGQSFLQNSELQGHAYRYTPGGGSMPTDLPVGNFPSANGINSSGNTVGTADEQAFLYTGTPGVDGVKFPLGQLSASSSSAWAINDAGQIAGSTRVPSAQGISHAFRYDGAPGAGGVMRDLGALGGLISDGYAINASGQVAGASDLPISITSRRHAFLYTGTPGAGGTMADLGTLSGDTSTAFGINDAGDVVGESTHAGGSVGSRHAFLYRGIPGQGGAMLDLGSLGGPNNVALDINNHRQIVGRSSRSPTNSAYIAMAYLGTPGIDGHMIDLDALLDAVDPGEGAKWILREATGISDTGYVSGTGNYDDGPGGLDDGRRPFLLNLNLLIPEPGCAAVISATSLLLRRRRRVIVEAH